MIVPENEIYYAHKDCPSYSDFGTPLLKDTNGRYYKLAFSNDNKFSNKSTKPEIIKNGLGSVKFYVKIPKGSSWYNSNELIKPITFYFYDDLNDKRLNLRIEGTFRDRNSKTGYVFINGQDLNKII